MAGKGRKWLEMVKKGWNCLTWLEMAGNDSKLQELSLCLLVLNMTGFDYDDYNESNQRVYEMSENRWNVRKWLACLEMAEKRLETAGNSWEWLEWLEMA